MTKIEKTSLRKSKLFFIGQESQIGNTELMQWGVFDADLNLSSNLHKLE
jgi:hypothetical protein